MEARVAAGDIDGAAALAQRAIACGAVHARLFEVRGMSALRAGRFAQALDDLDRARSLAPKNAATLCRIAECLNAMGRPRMALLACGDALAIDGALTAAWFQKGHAHQQMNQPDRARDSFLRAVQCDPTLAAGFAQLANLAALQGQGERARDFARRALAIDPGEILAVVALARADLADARYDEAEPRLHWLIDNAADPRIRAFALGGIGDIRDAEGRHGDAFRAYEEAGAAAAHEHQAPAFSAEPAHAQVRRMIALVRSLPAQTWGATSH